jgi:hypothetical protein
MILTQLVKVIPVIQTRFVAIVKKYFDRVLAYRNHITDVDLFFPGDEFQHIPRVTPDFSGRRVNPQVLAGQLKACPIVKGDFQGSGLLMKCNTGWMMGGHDKVLLKKIKRACAIDTAYPPIRKVQKE